jgi:hypothetical protein
VLPSAHSLPILPLLEKNRLPDEAARLLPDDAGSSLLAFHKIKHQENQIKSAMFLIFIPIFIIDWSDRFPYTLHECFYNKSKICPDSAA